MSDRIFRGLVAACSLSLLAACGGTRHIGDITPPVVQRLSGVWMLNVTESDDPAAVMRRQGGQRRGERPGGRTGGVGGGVRGGGSMPPGRPQAARGRMSPEAMQALRRLATARPVRLDVQLTDSAVAVTYTGDPEPLVLLFGKKVERKLTDELTLEAKASWEEGRLVVERSVGGAGSITETFMPSVDGRRLTVDVALDGGAGGGLEFQRVYDREGPSAPR